jgi:hypothetical protein
MPAHKKLVVGGEDAAIEYLERRLEQGWPGALQNHPRLLREGSRQLAPVRAARQIEIDKGVGPGRKRRDHPAKDARALKETTPTWGADEVLGGSHGITRPSRA